MLQGKGIVREGPYNAGSFEVGTAPPFWIRSSVTGPVLACISGMPWPWPTGDVKEVGRRVAEGSETESQDGTF